MDLAVRVINIRRIDGNQNIVIKEGIPGDEITGQVPPPDMTRAASMDPLISGKVEGFQGWIGFFRGIWMFSLPEDMVSTGAMTGFTTHPHLGPNGGIGVIGFVVLLSQAGVVTEGAHAVPVHPSAGPVSPLTGFPIFVAIDVEPFLGMGIPGQLGDLVFSFGARDKKLPQRVIPYNPFQRIGLPSISKSQGH